ncbi:hypothetical protein CCR83_02680 [Rhodobacter veldkampii DSM 11550]|nr:hypothetical protein [Phaeovulum veldkampii DSM 11550]
MSENSAVARLATDVFSPAAFEFLFWRPRHFMDSRALAHLPLLFWVCAALRPRQATVVGVGDGVVHFALCQAMEKLDGQGRCTGYGFWKDATSEGVATMVPADLARHQEMLYEEISRFIPSRDPDAIADGLAQNALDLLWLDLAASPGGLGQRADLFARSVKRSGVMFVHGIRAIAENSADGAAIKRLLNSQRCVRFDDEMGLLLVVFDGDVPTRLEALVTATEETALPPEVERVFRRVGQGLLASVRGADAVTARKKAEQRAADARAACDTAEGALKDLNSAYDLRARKLAQVQSELFDARMLVVDLRAEIVDKDGERLALEEAQERALAEMEGQFDTVTAEADGLREQVAAAEDARVALEAAHERALAEMEGQLDTVTAEADGLREQVQVAAAEDARVALEAAHERALAEMEGQLDTVTAEADGLREQVAAAEDARVALEAAHKRALAEVETSRRSLQASLESERATRFSETAALTRMAEDLREEVAKLTSHNRELAAKLDAAETRIKQKEEKSKTEITSERQLRFKETAALTRMLEDLKAEGERKKRPFEKWLVENLVRSERKRRKYSRNRFAYFSDSKSTMARVYFRLRPGS